MKNSSAKKKLLISFDETDKRSFLLQYQAPGFLSTKYQLPLTQLDLLQIMKHLRGRNARLHERFQKMIIDIDADSNMQTNFNRKIPQRGFNGRV